jgi:hypothetical protein
MLFGEIIGGEPGWCGKLASFDLLDDGERSSGLEGFVAGLEQALERGVIPVPPHGLDPIYGDGFPVVAEVLQGLGEFEAAVRFHERSMKRVDQRIALYRPKSIEGEEAPVDFELLELGQYGLVEWRSEGAPTQCAEQ